MRFEHIYVYLNTQMKEGTQLGESFQFFLRQRGLLYLTALS